MHQGGNKSGARARGKYLFSFTWAHCQNRRTSTGRKRETRKPGGKGHVEEDVGRGRRGCGNRERVFERRGREIPRAIYGMVIEILRTGPAFAKHVRTRDLPSREMAHPSPPPSHTTTDRRDPRSPLFFLRGITRNSR